MSRPVLTETEAVEVVRQEGRRLIALGAVGLAVAFLLYLAVSVLFLDRPIGEALTRGVPLVAVVALLSYFFQVPAWARRPGAGVSQARVGRVDEGELTLQGGPDGDVTLPLPRGTTGFRRGDAVWVSPQARPAEVVGVVVPPHVTAPRPVISGRATSTTARA